MWCCRMCSLKSASCASWQDRPSCQRSLQLAESVVTMVSCGDGCGALCKSCIPVAEVVVALLAVQLAAEHASDDNVVAARPRAPAGVGVQLHGRKVIRCATGLGPRGDRGWASSNGRLRILVHVACSQALPLRSGARSPTLSVASLWKRLNFSNMSELTLDCGAAAGRGVKTRGMARIVIAQHSARSDGTRAAPWAEPIPESRRC